MRTLDCSQYFGDLGPEAECNHSPANRCARHGGDDPWSKATKEARVAMLPLDDGCCPKNALGRPYLDIIRRSSCLQEGFDDVQGSCQTRSKRACQRSRAAVSDRIVAFASLEELG